MTLPATKACTMCGVEKSLDDFTPHKVGKSGRYSYCRPCNAAYVKAQNSDPAARARGAERQRERRKDPAKVVQDRATSLAWKKRNLEQVKAMNAAPSKVASNKAWNRANLDKRAAASRRYAAAHPGYGKNAQARRRARLASAVSTLTQSEWLNILSEFHHRCAYCLRNDLPLQQEHLIPIARGGTHEVGNVIPSCGPCNYRKHTKNLLQFLSNSGE